MILYCTLLASSQSDTDRNKIKQQMNEDTSLAKILIQLDTGNEIILYLYFGEFEI